MTHEEALLKLLAVEPETKAGLIRVTGWPVEETVATLERLLAERVVSYRNGVRGAPSYRLYYPRAAA